ncbi:MAG TPA: SRPBCC domain-containing protein [Bradyrhizobium sp.]|uniref:SRPBCC family protein n=1 Tax=Bradyrhizobium sp. TaxID=376 RepID=UPI002D0B6227|nr:SRPBCC domain-containing protein [Bradyrhizobium sp.]HLZ04188.1 SRPBCC domain-containing protein [Bradyrhizobium sp.]
MAQPATAPKLAERPSLALTRRIRARPEKVYAAWTEPQNLVRWFGPASAKPGTLHADLDVRVGGRYRIQFEKNDGEYCEVGGLYRDVVPNERLQFTWAWHSTPERESLVTIEFKLEAGGTLLVFNHAQFVDETARDNHARGWNELFAKLDEFVS